MTSSTHRILFGAGVDGQRSGARADIVSPRLEPRAGRADTAKPGDTLATVVEPNVSILGRAVTRRLRRDGLWVGAGQAAMGAAWGTLATIDLHNRCGNGFRAAALDGIGGSMTGQTRVTVSPTTRRPPSADGCPAIGLEETKARTRDSRSRTSSS